MLIGQTARERSAEHAGADPLLLVVCLVAAWFAPCVQAVQFQEAGSMASPTNATAMIYSPGYNRLVVKNSASAIVTISLATQSVSTRLANINFTDIALSPSGRYVFAADYGGENIGYGTPAQTHYVHRLDLSTMTWESKTAYIAANVQPVADAQVILKSRDQWVTFTNNAWGPGGALVPLNTPSGAWGPGYYPIAYFGDFRYVASTGRLLFGNSNSSSQEIAAFRLVANEFVPQESTGTYGSAQGYGGTVVLATDGSAFYYGRLQVDPLDVTQTRRIFPEPIYAATADIAFGGGAYYDAHTGQQLGTLGFPATVYGLNPNGIELWAYDAGQNRLRRFIASASGGTACGSGSFPFPYTDVGPVGDAFCPGILQAYVLGVTKGTSPTTFSPNDPVSRVQMTTFLQRSQDQGLRRSSRRAALNQWWSPQSTQGTRAFAIGGASRACASDGDSIWVPVSGAVLQLQAGTGKLVGTWTGATGSGNGVVVAAGKVFVSGLTSGGQLHAIDPTQPAGPVSTVSTNLGDNPGALAFDGARLWSANATSVSIITPQASAPYPVTTVSTGFAAPAGILFDGTDIWMTDRASNKLHRLDALGGIMQTVNVGTSPREAVYDGANIWVPNVGDHSITVVNASTGAIVATIATNPTNKLNAPTSASFDGERILVTNTTGNGVSVFRAADLSFIANVDLEAASGPQGACSDGVNFWVSLPGASKLVRF